MNKFDNAWSFAKAHPFISLLALQAVVSGVVSVTKYLTKPFVKVPEYGLDDVVKVVMDRLKADEEKLDEPAETETEIIDISDQPSTAFTTP